MADELVIRAVADHLFSRDTLVEADGLAKRAPEQLTDLHLSHLACYCSDKELTAIVRRRADAIEKAEDAFRANVHAAQQRAVADTRAAAAAPLTAASLEGITTIEALCEKFPDHPLTLGMFVEFHAFVMQINERNKERNAKIAALETHAAGLQKQLADLRVELDALLQVRS